MTESLSPICIKTYFFIHYFLTMSLCQNYVTVINWALPNLSKDQSHPLTLVQMKLAKRKNAINKLHIGIVV